MVNVDRLVDYGLGNIQALAISTNVLIFLFVLRDHLLILKKPLILFLVLELLIGLLKALVQVA